PPSRGDYLLIAVAETDGSATSHGGLFALDVDGSEYGNVAPMLNGSGTTKMPWMIGAIVNLTSASHTAKTKCKANFAFGTTAGMQNIRILALRMDTLDNVYLMENYTSATTSSTSYVDQASATQTPLPLAHLVIACATVSDNDTINASFGQFLEGAISLAEQTH